MFRLLYLHVALNILFICLNLYHLIDKFATLAQMGELTKHLGMSIVFHIISAIATIVYLSIKEYKSYEKLGQQ